MKVRMIMTALLVASAGCGWPSSAQEPMVTEAQFEQIFPNHSPFYSYGGFVGAQPRFDDKREAAMFLANVHHETGGLTIVDEEVGRRGVYCDPARPYGCPAGPTAYFGRGPIQLSWNYNYQEAGQALGLNLLADPEMVSQSQDVAWRTAQWYWDTKVPPSSFGGTIDAINGAQECDGGNPGQVSSRVTQYRRIADILGVPTGGDLRC